MPTQPSSPAAFTPATPLTVLARAGVIFVGIGISVGLALSYARLSVDLTPFASENVVDHVLRSQTLKTLAVALAAVLALPGLYLAWHRSVRAVYDIERIAHILSPALFTFAVPLLFNWRVFLRNELLCVFFAALFGLGLERCFRLALRASDISSWHGALERAAFRYVRARRIAAAIAVTGAFLFMATYFTYYTLLNHYRLQTTSFDLAIFDNMMWNLTHGYGFSALPAIVDGGSHLHRHATLDAVLFAPIYALFPSARTLLTIQAVGAASAVFPIYLFTRNRLGSTAIALAFVGAYVVFAPLHGALFYDFHFITMTPAFVSWVFYFFETRRRWLLLLAWALAVALREDISAGLAAVSFFYLLSGQRVGVAVLGGLMSMAFFVWVKFIFMPSFSGGNDETFTYIYAGLIPPGERGFSGVLKTLITNPLFVLDGLMTKEKFAYVLKLLAPVLLLPLRSSAWLFILFPAITTVLTTGYDPVIRTTFQYAAHWTGYIFPAAVVTLSAWRARPEAAVRIPAAVLALLVTSAALSYQYGAIFQHNSFRGGFRHVRFEVTELDRKNHNDLYALIARIPPKASVVATESEAPHVSNRRGCYTMRVAHRDPDFLLAALPELRGGDSRAQFIAALETNKYGFIDVKGQYVLWGKGYPQNRNAEGRALLDKR